MFDPKTLIGYIVNGQYRLASLCGTGSYGWVYAADETAFGEVIGQVAVKLLRPPDEDARKAVIREVQAMRQLTHPNLLTCYAAGQVSDGLASGCLYIATELASETLDSRLQSPHRMTPDEVREVAEHMASALAYLCERGAVHRDVKPANILRAGKVWKLGDFGLVRGVEGTVARTVSPKGTVQYMSPESLDRETGPFVDVWALGVVIQECLTGTLPYPSGSDPQVVAAILRKEPAISPDLPDAFASIVRGCLLKDRKRRWTAKQVADALRSPQRTPEVVVAAPERRAETPAPPVHGSPRSGEVRTNPKDGAEMVYVPAGEFIMGSKDGPPNAYPQRAVYLEPFWIYRCPVTVAQYRKFCTETDRSMPGVPSCGWKDDHPIVNVTWHEANAYADWAGVALPTEAQWEKAARGTDGREYPWGDAFDASKAVCSSGSRRKAAAPVGSIATGASPYRCLDMAGNVWEWCADWYDRFYYALSPQRSPAGPARGERRVLRGGSWLSTKPVHLRAANRSHDSPDERYHGTGFRCASGSG